MKKVINGGTRTHNPQIRSLMRYPLRHADLIEVLVPVFTLKAEAAGGGGESERDRGVEEMLREQERGVREDDWWASIGGGNGRMMK